MFKKLVISLGVFLFIAAIGVLILKGGWSCYDDARHSGQTVSSSYLSSANHPRRLLFAITLFQLGTVVCAGAFLLGSRIEELDDRPMWAQGPRGILVMMGWLIGLLLPPLFLWEAWVVITECIFRGVPPIAWGRIGGASTDWVIFACLMLPFWLIAAVAGIFCPPYMFWSSLFRRS